MSTDRTEYFQNHPWQLATGVFLMFIFCFVLFLSGLGKVIIIMIHPQQTTGHVFSVERILTRTPRYIYEVEHMSFKGSVPRAHAETDSMRGKIEVTYSKLFPTLSIPTKSIPSTVFSGCIFLGLSAFFLILLVQLFRQKM